MSDSYLSDDEIAELTHPLVQGAARCRYLRREYGVRVVPRPDGQPRVGRAEFNAAMMSKDRAPLPAAVAGNVITPDFAALRAAGGRRKGA